ncbi:MAG: response regulator [Paracoccaceae bacterium]
MRVLIVESRKSLAQTWATYLRGQGWQVDVAHDQAGAIKVLNHEVVQIMLLDLVLDQGSALAIADYAGYRQPVLRVVFLTDTAVFSDGSIFRHCANACAFLQAETPVSDLAALVEHYARAA